MSEKEFVLPDTVFIRDVEGEVFQAIIVKCLSEIEDVALSSGNLIDHLLGREGVIKGVVIEQDEKNQSVAIKIDATAIPVNVCAISRGHGCNPRKSSHKPMALIAIAGTKTVLAKRIVCQEKSTASIDPYEAATTPIAIATPPRYGTGSF